MHDAVGILIPKLHLRNSELFPSYSESWMLQKQRERKEIFWTRWSLQSLTTQTILWLSVTELSNFTPLLHINLKKSFSCITPRHIWHGNFASLWCPSAAFLPVLFIPGTRQGHTPAHRARELQPEHCCCCPGKQSKLWKSSGLDVSPALLAQAARITGEVWRW